MRLPVSLGWKAGLLLVLAIQCFAPQASVSVNAQAVPDVGVTGIELPAGPVNQGDTAEIKVTIENLGSTTASVLVILNYLDTESSPGRVGQMMRDVEAGQTAKASFSWDTTNVPLGSYTFQAVALSGENLDGEDGNHENNSLISADAVTIVAQAIPDVGVTDIELPTGPVNQGDIAEIKVTIENLGSATASVMVILNYLDAESSTGSVGQMMQDVAAGRTAKASFSWDTTNVPPGSYTFQAVALSGENLDGEDGNHENNSLISADAVTIVAPTTTDVSVTGIQVPTDPVSQGDIIEIDVTVKNLGSATASVTVTLLDTTGPSQIAEKTEDIDADGTEVVTLAWDTTEASLGNHTLRAVAVLEGDTNIDNDSLLSSDAVTIVAPVTYGVSVTAVNVPAGPVTQGDTVSVDVTVENTSSVAAMFAVTLLYIPAEGEPGIAAEKTVALAAGASVTVTLPWDTSDATPGAYTITARAMLVGVAGVEDVADSRDAASTITVPPPYAVAITAVDVPAGPVAQGHTVTVDVTIENQGTADSTPAVTLLYIPEQGQPGIAAAETVAIAAGASDTIALAWNTSGVTPSGYSIRADATLVEDPDISDSQVAASTLTIGPPTYGVAVTALGAPAWPVTQGNTVEVDVTVQSLSSVPAMFTVMLLYVPDHGQGGIADEETVEITAGASVTITLSWDTSGAAPGAHTISGRAMLVEDREVVGFMDAGSTITINAPVTYGVAVKAVDVPTEISTGQVTQGDVVSVDVAIENTSSVTAMFAVTLFYQPASGQEGTAAEETFEITPGFTKGVTLSWDTSGVSPGVYKVGAKVMLVEVPGVDDVADSLVAEMTPITIIAPVTYGVAVTAVDGPAGPAAQGETVDVDVTIENSSSVTAMFTVTLFYQPADGQEVTATEETVEIDAGAIETVTLNWDTSGATPDVYTIRAKAVLVRVAGVDDVTHSLVAATPLTVSAPVTYGVAITGIDVPAGPAALGAEVAVDVTVENLGNTEVNAEVTLLYQPDRGQGGTADEKTVQIVPGASVTITLSWDTSGVTPGVHTMRAGVTLVEDSDARDFLDSASTITVVSGRIILGDGQDNGFPDASFGGTLAAAPVETTPSLVTRFLIFGGFAKGYKTSSPVIETSLVPHDKLFTTNAQATFGSGLQNPFELGEIRVTVHLEERPNSLGAYVMVGSQTFFAGVNGNCRIVVPSGVYDLAIQAPGYVSARIPGLRLGIGEAVTVPELTLPFGDANGDGQIDILDLSVAAGNFGATMQEISLP